MNTSSIRKLTLSLAVASSIVSHGILRADLGDNNPTGVSGQFNGNVTTGCSYDPYTGNADRSITDIVVPGSVGTYPLAFVRTINTRTSYGNMPLFRPFGRAGGWRHNYQWEVDTITIPSCTTLTPAQYTVNYPDGRIITFNSTGNPEKPGIGDRFLPVTVTPSAETSDAYLLLRDGGRIHFTVEFFWNCEDGGSDVQLVFHLAGIIDPYNQETTAVNTFNSSFSTLVVKEPAGRNLTILWEPMYNTRVVTRVDERLLPDPNTPPSRTVQYHYETLAGEPALDRVEYFGDLSLTAHYTYQASNANPTLPQLIRTCNDTMYAGPMSKIAYDFAPGEPHGFLWRERYFDGTDANNGPAVSTLFAPNENTRFEIRGDGPIRTFIYENGLLKEWTDFQDHHTLQDHFTSGPTGFVSYIRDALGFQTDFLRDPITGNVTQITYPQPPSEPSATPATMQIGYDLNDPYHVTSVTNERLKQTAYRLDRAHGTARVTDITYPDRHVDDPPGYYPYEHFEYSPFGQVTKHRRKNKYYEHFAYDPRGLLIHRWNPTLNPEQPAATSTSMPKTTFTYYPLGDPWQDRVQSITDPRGYITHFEYDRSANGQQRIAGRGLVTKITHPDNTYKSLATTHVAIGSGKRMRRTKL